MIKQITILLLCISLIGWSDKADAQTDHQGRVTTSFTEPIETNVVAAIDTGVIHESKVKEGDRVTAGAPLAVLNSEVLIQTRRLAIVRAESTAALDAATAKTVLLKSQKENLESLAPGGHVNKYELEQKTSEYENAVAELKRAENEVRINLVEVDRIDAQIEQRIIKSPIDGFITRIHKKLGEQVSTNEPQYATVVRIDQLKVRFYLNEETLSSLQKGDNVTVLLGTKSQPQVAKVLFVSPIIDPDSGTGRVEVIIDNRDFRVRSGTVCCWGTGNETLHQANQHPPEIK